MMVSSDSSQPPPAATMATNPLPTARNPPIQGYQSLVKDQPAIQSQEMTKYLRQKFKVPQRESGYHPEHVILKTSTFRIPSPDKEGWRRNFLRRRCHLESGFFTPSYKPYLSVGAVELNPQQVVLGVYQGCLNKKVPLPSILTGGRPARTPPSQDVAHDPMQSHSQIHHSVAGPDFTEEDIESAGFTLIKRRLKESETVMVANRGGQPLDRCMLEIESKRDQINEEDQQCAVLFLPPSPEDQSAIVPTMEIYAVQISSAPDPARPCSKMRAAEEDRERVQERIIFDRSRRMLVERLKTIQMVLNALHNMKSRDLKSRIPLPADTVRVLYRDVVEKQSRPAAKTEVLHSSNDTVNSVEKPATVGKISKTAVRPSRTEGLQVTSTTPTPQWRKHRQHIVHPRKEPKVETWEDLLSVSSSPTHGHRNSVLPTTNNIVGRWFGAHQRVPPWQGSSLSSEDNVKRPVVMHEGGMKQLDPETALRSLIESFQRIKKKLAREVHSDLDKLLRDRNRTFRQKFQCLNRSPLFEKTVHCLKGVSAIQPMPLLHEETTADMKSSKWFTDLKSGAENIVGREDREVNVLLQQLARFSLEDSKSIPNAKEKLCLLVMSMPASHLLTIPAQQALQFVAEEILWGPSDLLSQWLSLRKIPLILQEFSH